MPKNKFVNEVGNHIEIRVKKKNGIGTNSKTNEKIKYKGVCIKIIGPTSEAEWEITNDEAKVLIKILKEHLSQAPAR